MNPMPIVNFHSPGIRPRTTDSPLLPITWCTIPILIWCSLSIVVIVNIPISIVVVIGLILIVALSIYIPLLINSSVSSAAPPNDRDQHQNSEETHEHKHEPARHLAGTHGDDAVEENGEEAGDDEAAHDLLEATVGVRRLMHHVG